MQRLMLLSLAFIGLFAKVAQAGCANACSGHGTCSKNDMCKCEYRWSGNDCSQQLCQSHPSWVDSGAGDLNADGVIAEVTVTVVRGSDDYPRGTSEKFTPVVNSDQEVVPNTGHGYSACANKGTCDKQTGLCECFDGFYGSGCQYGGTCINDCSGHGTCVSKRELAFATYENTYALWDKDSLRGCKCDPNHYGVDCSEKYCPIGVDPLAEAGYKAISKNNFTFEFFTTGTGAGYIKGNYSLYFEDAQGNHYQTDLLDIRSTCGKIRKAIQELPMKMLSGPISCHRSTASRGYIFNNDTGYLPYGNNGQETRRADPVGPDPHDWIEIDLEGQETIQDGRFVYEKYTLVFDDIYRQLKTPTIIINSNGVTRPTLQAYPSIDEKLHLRVFRNGFKAENTDLFYHRCDGVLICLDDTKKDSHMYNTLSCLEDIETDLLKICLGDADGDNSNNVEVFNWDYGTTLNPHIAHLVEETQNQAFKYNPQDAQQGNPLHFWANDGVNLNRKDQSVVPTTRLCNDLADHASESARFNQSVGGDNLCSNKDPGPILIVFYWVAADEEFAVFNPLSKIFGKLANNDFTQFSVWTTTSTLQVVSPYVNAITHINKLTGDDELSRDFTPVIHTTNGTNGTWAEDNRGNTACENVVPTGVSGSGNGYQQCTSIGDEIVLLVLPGYVSGNPNSAAGVAPNSYGCNPIFTNIYTIMKTTQTPLSSDTIDGELNDYRSRKYRNVIILDTGTNAKFDEENCAATMFKIIRNTTEYPKGGPEYRGECSTRGDCDSTSGKCECNSGFTGQACGVQDVDAI